jgi:hypothetical protein
VWKWTPQGRKKRKEGLAPAGMIPVIFRFQRITLFLDAVSPRYLDAKTSLPESSKRRRSFVIQNIEERKSASETWQQQGEEWSNSTK